MKKTLQAIFGATITTALILLLCSFIAYVINHPELYLLAKYTVLIVCIGIVWWFAYRFFREILQ